MGVEGVEPSLAFYLPANATGIEGIEPPTTVLETVVIPFN